MTPQECIRRLDKSKALRSNVNGVFEDIGRYIMPLSQGRFYGSNDSEGSKDWSTREVWDSTAPIGCQRLASMIYSSKFSPSFRWFAIGFRDTKVNQDREAKAWIEAVTDRMFDALSASNFGLEMASALLSMVGLGNTFLIEEPLDPKVWKGLDFAAVPMGEMFAEPDWKGRPRVAWREYEWTAGQIVSKFTDPETGKPVNIPDAILQEEQAGSDRKHGVVLAIYPRESATPMTRQEKFRAPDQRHFEYCYILRESKVKIGTEGGYYEMPVFQGRWDRAVGSDLGFGPGHLALPTVKLVNAWLEAITDAAEKHVDPATLVTERGLLSDLNLRRGGLTTVRSKDDIWPYESGANFAISETLLQDMRNMIRKHFREDDLSLKDSPAMTATEAQLRVEMLNRLFGTTNQRIDNDLSDPILQTTFNLMWRADQFPPPPQIVLDSNPTMQVEYLGPFARSQRTDEVAAIERLAAAASAMKKMEFPVYRFDPDGALKEMAERLATPAACMKSDAQVAQAMEQAEKTQQAAAAAEIGKKAAEADRAAAGAQQMMREGAA